MTPEYLRSQLDYDPDTGVFRWKAPKQGRTVGRQTGQFDGRYVMISIDGKKYYAHRLAWLYSYGSWPNGEIDHKNEIKTDNRLINLVDSNRSKNMANQRNPNRNSTTGFRGVTRRRNRWRATFKRQHLGDFNTPEEASQAYLGAKK